MAQIRTIDGKRHDIEETLDQVNNQLRSQSCLDSGILELSMQCTVSGFKNGEETTKRIYTPVIFIKSNVMMIY
jgi:hypothetical protein